MQEAKRSCRGQWYLPAGKVEPGETIEVCGMVGKKHGIK
jgi:8-oxo-dGTP pyrophosphatase MutT (NUDIX family)